MDTSTAKQPQERRVWLNQESRIASFHEAEGFELMLLKGQEDYERFIQRMQEQGFRFQ